MSVGWAVLAAAGLLALAMAVGFAGRAAFLANALLQLDERTLTYRDLRRQRSAIPLSSIAEVRRVAVEIKPRTGIFFHYIVCLDAHGNSVLKLHAPGWPLTDLATLFLARRVRFDPQREEQMSLRQAARQYPGMFSWLAVHWQFFVVVFAVFLVAIISLIVVVR